MCAIKYHKFLIKKKKVERSFSLSSEIIIILF